MRRLFAVISRLGDGVFWYVLMAALVVLDGFDGLRASAHGRHGLAALLLPRSSRWTRRRGPIRAWVAPLDEFSFLRTHPACGVVHHRGTGLLPWLAPLLVPFTCGVALSRVVLGLSFRCAGSHRHRHRAGFGQPDLARRRYSPGQILSFGKEI